jgi:hypothetical protein
LFDRVARSSALSPPPGSDCLAELIERCCDAQTRLCFDPEFVVAAADVLHERVACDDHVGGAVGLEAAHWSQSGLETAVVAFDPVIRVLLVLWNASGTSSSIAVSRA